MWSGILGSGSFVSSVMASINSPLVLAYTLSVLGGGVVAWLFVSAGHWALNREFGRTPMPRGLWWLSFLMGFFERTIITTLLIWTPRLAPTFIGGWVLLKFAGGWGRFKEPTVENRAIYMVALMGNAISIAFAIFGALYVAPHALETFRNG